MDKLFKQIKIFFELVKFEHTIFALPFAYLGMLMAGNGQLRWSTFGWVSVAMVTARTTGMTLNRIIDLDIDRLNPRTKNRPLVTGAMSLKVARIVAIVSGLLFFVAVYFLNPLCLKLSPVALVIVASYHWTKRFTWLCHLALGLVLGIAPVGGWLAVTGVWNWTPVLLGLAVVGWVTGFDILYSLQDIEFDRTHKLHSIPVRFGQEKALFLAEVCHWASVFFLILFGFIAGLGILYWLGVLVVAGLLKFQHLLLKDGDLSKIQIAFFNVNGWVGILLLIFTFLEIYR